MNVALDFSNRELLPRLDAAALVPLTFASRSIETAIGAFAGLAAIFTLGMQKETLDFAAKQLSSSQYIFSNPYVCLLRMINPNRENSEILKSANISISFAYIHHKEMHTLDRIPSQITFIDRAAIELSQSDNFLESHVLSRLTYVLFGVSCIIDSLANSILSIPAVTLSILTLGKYTRLNRVAYDSLSSTTGIIGNLFYAAIRIINPHSNTSLSDW